MPCFKVVLSRTEEAQISEANGLESSITIFPNLRSLNLSENGVSQTSRVTSAYNCETGSNGFPIPYLRTTVVESP
jgi:hypothetical protein